MLDLDPEMAARHAEKRLLTIEAFLETIAAERQAVERVSAPVYGHSILTPNPFEGAGKRLASLTPFPTLPETAGATA